MWYVQARPLDYAGETRFFITYRRNVFFSIVQFHWTFVQWSFILPWHSRQKIVVVSFVGIYWLLITFVLPAFQFVFAMAFSYLSRWLSYGWLLASFIFSQEISSTHWTMQRWPLTNDHCHCQQYWQVIYALAMRGILGLVLKTAKRKRNENQWNRKLRHLIR